MAFSRLWLYISACLPCIISSEHSREVCVPTHLEFKHEISVFVERSPILFYNKLLQEYHDVVISFYYIKIGS